MALKTTSMNWLPLHASFGRESRHMQLGSNRGKVLMKQSQLHATFGRPRSGPLARQSSGRTGEGYKSGTSMPTSSVSSFIDQIGPEEKNEKKAKCSIIRD